jgi:hypothetical protein
MSQVGIYICRRNEKRKIRTRTFLSFFLSLFIPLRFFVPLRLASPRPAQGNFYRSLNLLYWGEKWEGGKMNDGRSELACGHLLCPVGRLPCQVGHLRCLVGHLRCLVGRLRCRVGRVPCRFGYLERGPCSKVFGC